MRIYKVTMTFSPREYLVWLNGMEAGRRQLDIEIVDDHDIRHVDVSPALGIEKKPRKPRRTKAQIEADKMALENAKAP